MKKLFVAAPMLVLAGTFIVQSCGNGDQGGVMGGGGAKGQGGSNGSGGSGNGGAQGMGGMNQGMGGANVGGANGTGGQQGTGGMTGMGGMTGVGGALIGVAQVLDGKMFLGPCLSDTQAAVCLTKTGNCPQTSQANTGYFGVLTTDRTLTLGGTPGTSYDVQLHVQGEVESKQYGGADQERTKQSPAADGFCTGGKPVTTDNYNIYALHVTNPGSTTSTDYFLNSLQPPGVSNHTTYGIDYLATITVQGGATIRMIAADTNCSMIKNCGPTQNDGNTCAAPITLQNIEPSAVTANPTFDFTKAYNGQWIVLTVKTVTLAKVDGGATP